MPVQHLSPYGTPKYSGGAAVAASVATMTALAAFLDGAPERVHGNEIRVDADGSLWKWHSTSTLTSDGVLVESAADVATVTAGRWLRVNGIVDLSMAFTYATADAATLLTLPTGVRMYSMSAYWRVTTGFTGGSSSAIGVSSNKTGFSTKGDILGGAAGDVAATLVSSGTQNVVAGTIGPKMDTLTETKILLVAGDTIRFDQITSAFTAGVGEVHIVAALLANPGA